MRNKYKIVTLLIVLLTVLATDSWAQERFFEIKAKKFSYTPNMIKVNKGDLIRIRLLSEDVHHGFFLDGYEIKMTAYPGKSGSLKFIADKTGRFVFRCSVTCGEFHPYMVGYLLVQPNSRFLFFAGILAAVAILSLLFLYLRRGKESENGQR